MLSITCRHNHGHLIYALDDPYIHMAMAKHLVQDGVWGIDGYKFTSSSSSSLWVLLLSLSYLVFGANEVTPFILNLIFAVLLMFSTYFILRRRFSFRPVYILIVLLSVLFFTPLAPLVFFGQEHTMHAFLSLLFMFLSAGILSNEGSSSNEYVLLLILAPLVTAARYEGAFLVSVVAALFLLRKMFRHSFLLLAAGFLPILVYGLISVAKGWYPLPNPIMLKGIMPDFSSARGISYALGYKGLLQISKDKNAAIFLLFIEAFIFIILKLHSGRKFLTDRAMILLIFPAIVFIHMELTGTGWYSYEQYVLPPFIIALSLVILFRVIKQRSLSDSTKYLVLILAAAVFLHVQSVSAGRYAYDIYLVPLSLYVVALVVASRFFTHAELWDKPAILALIYVPVVFLHLQFARTMGFYRYEAYIIAMGILVIAVSIHEYLPIGSIFEIGRGRFLKRIGMSVPIVLLFPLMILLCIRAWDSLRDTCQATTNIYEQQYQMGLFLKSFYRKEAVAANDIGAINYLADIRCVDLWGLANMEVARLKRRRAYYTQEVYSLAKENRVKIALVYDSWYRDYGGLPRQWIKAGSWIIRHNVVCGSDTVSFYAVDSSEKDSLFRHLEAFSSRLPDDVIQEGAYTR